LALNRAVTNFGSAVFVDPRCGVHTATLYDAIDEPLFTEGVVSFTGKVHTCTTHHTPTLGLHFLFSLVGDTLGVGYVRDSEWYTKV
jgi:hypothetical protein